MDEQRFHRESRRALRARDYRALAGLCRSMREAVPDYADAWFLESVAAEAGRNPGAALQLVERAIALDPVNVEYRVQQARYHAQVNQVGEALAAAQRALALGVEQPAHLDTLGVVLTRAGDYEAAAEVLRRAVAGRPDNPQMHFNLAAAEQFLGNDAEARRHFERVIELEPRHARSYWALSELEKTAVSDRHEAAMRHLASAPGLDPRDSLYLAHALARIDESRGNYAAAIAQLTAAKARRRATFNYRFEDDQRLFAVLHREFATAADVAAAADAQAGGDGPAPLFIVGMPRSGTTLLERIVAAHPEVETLGELQALPSALHALSGVGGTRVFSAQVVEALSRQSPALAAAYARALAPRLGKLPAAPTYVVDKMPLNFFFLGFVFRLMPRARVLLLRRHPMDTGLSNFRQLFALEFSYYNYSYDLADTGRYVAAFEHLMSHWESLLGERLHSVRYETLVAEPETVVRGVLDYLQLPWDAACLEFHARGGAVATPSAAQVRQPLYRSAVGRWRRYGDALKPLQEALVAAGVDVDQA